MSRTKSSSQQPPLPFRILEALSSVRLTLISVILAMILIAAGTIAQTHLSSFDVQKQYFNSFWVWQDIKGMKLPVFPGGLTIGLLWLAGLIASFVTRFKVSKKHFGLLVVHGGLILLLVGQLLTQLLSRESQMPLGIGQTLSYSQDARLMELAIIKTSDPDMDTVTSIPEGIFSREGAIELPGLPIHIVVRRYFQNANLTMVADPKNSLATQGIGTRVAAEPLPEAGADEINNVSAYIEVIEGAHSLGTWLISAGLGAPQGFQAQGATYRMMIRPRRYYLPFTLTLNEFRHDVYPGTDIPKNFSSLVTLSDPLKNEFRKVLIYMNHPLRYGGQTFYQASFGEGDRVSVLQVVQNPAAIGPYLFCALVILGLMMQFMSHLLAFLKRQP